MSNDDVIQWNLARLSVFLTVAKEGSLTRAAAILGQAQSAVSRQISKLESECGGRLFHRTGRGVSLSDLGSRVLPRMEALVREAQELSSATHKFSHSPTGNVRIGALPSLYPLLIIPIFLHLRSTLPGIRLQVFEGSAGQIDQWLSNGYVDIGLPYRYGKHLSSDVEPLARVSSFLLGCSGDTLTSNPTIRFAKLAGVPLVLPVAPSGIRLALDQLSKRAGITLNVVIEADSIQIQKALARLGGIYSVLPAHSASEELDAGTLQASRIVEPEIDRTIVIGITTARPASRATVHVARLIRTLSTSEKAHRFLSSPQTARPE